MPLSFRIIVVFFTLFFCISLQANTHSNLSLEQVNKLATHKTWLKLLHYETSIFSSILKSEITNTDFFLSPLGSTDPALELNATVSALLNDEQGDNAAICRFPARAIWLAKMLPNLKINKFKTSCPLLNEYKNDMKAQSISVIYASGYLGNPASMYGHLLLKVNSDNNSKLLDNTFNYGAIYPKDEPSLRYITLGITGGYQARFATEAFHRHNHIYNESELRDMWEYQLKLTTQDVEFLLMHYWELRSQTFTYYFFKQNCAYQIAKLLELVIDRPLMHPNKSWVMPYDIVRGINEKKEDEKSVIERVIKHQSRQESFYDKFSQLSSKEQHLAEDIIHNKDVIKSPSFNQLKAISKKRITDTLLDYFNFINIKNEGLTPVQKQTQRQLLLARFSQSVGKINWNNTTKSPPHKAQYPTLLQISPTYYSDNKNSIELRFKANYYDLLSLEAGRMKNTSLSMFDLRLAIDDNGISLARWDLLNIENLNASQTGLPEDDALSWALNIGVAPVNNECENCLATGVTGAVGKSYSFNNDLTLYSMVEGKIHAPSRELGYLKAGIRFGSLITLSPSWAMRLDVGYHSYLNDSHQKRHTINWQQRFGQAKDWDIRTEFSFDGTTKMQLSYSHYW